MRTWQRPFAWVGVGVTALMAAPAALAEVVSVSIPAAAIERHVTEDGSAYYVISLDVPAGIPSIRHAWLELRMDVSSVPVEGFADPAPVLEVYGLTDAFTGAINPKAFVQTRLPMSRPVATGKDRVVKIDVTEALQQMISASLPDPGLVIGAISRGNEGVFTMSLQAGGVMMVLASESVDE